MGKKEEAVETLQYLLKTDKNPLLEEDLLEKTICSYSEEKEPELDWKQGIKLMLAIHLTSLVFIGILNYIPEVQDDSDISIIDRMIKNIFTAITFGFPSDILSGILPSIKCIGRKGFLFVFTSIGMVCLITSFLAPGIKVQLISGSYAAFAVNWSGVILLTSEYFPPESRNRALSFVCLAGRLGDLLSVSLVQVTLSFGIQGPVFTFMGLGLCLYLVISTIKASN